MFWTPTTTSSPRLNEYPVAIERGTPNPERRESGRFPSTRARYGMFGASSGIQAEVGKGGQVLVPVVGGCSKVARR